MNCYYCGNELVHYFSYQCTNCDVYFSFNEGILYYIRLDFSGFSVFTFLNTHENWLDSYFEGQSIIIAYNTDKTSKKYQIEDYYLANHSPEEVKTKLETYKVFI